MNNLIFTDIIEHDLNIVNGQLKLTENNNDIVLIDLSNEFQFDRASKVLSRWNNSYDRSLIIQHLKNFGIATCTSYWTSETTDFLNRKIGQIIRNEFDILDLLENDLKRFSRDSEYYPMIAINGHLNIEHKRGKHATKTKCFINMRDITKIRSLVGFGVNFAERNINLAILMNCTFLDTLTAEYIEFKSSDDRVGLYKTETDIYKISKTQVYDLDLKYCNDCEYWFDRAETHLIDGQRYCKTCRSAFEYEIKSHNYEPEQMQFIKLSPTGKIKAYTRANFDIENFYGIELEVALRSNCKKSKLEIVNDILKDAKTSNGKDIFYIVNDGSVCDGFEIVSYPMTYKAIQELDLNALLFRYRKYVKSLKTNNCGMHIHVSRNSFSNYNVLKAMNIVYKNKEFTRFVAERTTNDLNQWAPITERHYRDVKSALIECKDYQSRIYKKYVKAIVNSKYNAMNFSKRQTIEFRIFKGNLNNQNYRKNVEYIQALKEYSKVTSWKNVNINTFLGFVKSNYKSYENLNKFLNQNKKDMQQALQLDK